MRSAISGDSAAYHRLLKAVTPVLRAAARRGLARAGQPVDQSEDVVQDILLAVHLKRHTWDANAPFAPWLFAIARNKLIDALRRRGRRGFFNIDDFAATPLWVAIFFGELGVRPDVMTAMRNPFFDLKFAVTLALAISAIAVSLHLSRPEASLQGWTWLLLIPAGLLVAGIGSEMMMPQRLPMMTRLDGSNSRGGLIAIPLMSLPLLAAALIGLRHGAPTRPARAGAIAGLLSAGLAATLYASHCTHRFPPFGADL